MKYVSTSLSLVSLMFLLTACGSVGELNTTGRSRVNPTVKASQANQSSLPAPGSTDLVPYIAYESLTCEAEWDQYCDTRGTLKIEAPANWQVCKPTYNVGSQGGDRGFDFWATSWYPDDKQRPSRFRAFIVRVWANGSGFPKDKWGSNIQLKDIGILMIPADADNDARRKAGCELRYDVYKTLSED